MEDTPVVMRGAVMAVFIPLLRLDMDFNIARRLDSAQNKNTVLEIGSLAAVEPPRFNYFYRHTPGGAHRAIVKKNIFPDELYQFF